MEIVELWRKKGGYFNWWLQRVSAVFPLLLLSVILYFWWVEGVESVIAWHRVFQMPWVNVVTVLASLSILIHAYLGIWTVCTDYIHCVSLRRVIHLSILVMLVTLFVWGFSIAAGVGL